MISEQMERLFYENGYNKTPSNLPEFTFYWRKENQGVTVIFVIDYRQGLYISKDQYAHMKERVVEFFRAREEWDIHILSLILSGDTQKAKQLCISDPFCWMIDTGAGRLIIHENQVADFYGWKTILEDFVMHQPCDDHEGGDIGGNAGKNAGAGADADLNGNVSPPGGRAASDQVVRGWMKRGKGQAAKLPWVNICLVTVNVVVFLICTFTGEVLYNKGASGVTDVVGDGSYYRIVSSMFLHSDIQHLFSNMIVLYYVGEIVEKKIGHIPYLALYFLSGIMGNIFSMGYELWSGDFYSSVGASGAVFGVEGALLLLIILHHGRMESMTIGRLAFAIAFSLYCGFTSSYINNAAHIGGVLTGFAGAAVIVMLCPRIRMGKDKEGNEG